MRKATLLGFGLSVSIFLSAQSIFAGHDQKGGGDWETLGKGVSSGQYVLPVAANEIKVMWYNVENLFDANHDDGKNDWEFLPINFPGRKAYCGTLNGDFRQKCMETDWTAQKVALKLQQIKVAVSMQGSLPDIMAVGEVENPLVVADLARVLGYQKFVMTNSPDQRGIDTAIMYNEDKVKFIDFNEVVVTGKQFDDHPTRNLSVAHFAVQTNKGVEYFGVYPNHWPSQAHPSVDRMTVAMQLKNLIDADFAKYGQRYNTVVLGDFNTIDKDSPNGLKTVLEDGAWKNSLQDLQSMYLRTNDPMKSVMPPGSYYFPKEEAWNQLDHIYVSRGLMDMTGIDVDITSFRIVADPGLSKRAKSGEMVPKRYDHDATSPDAAGFSDHYPVVMKLQLQ